VTDQPIPPEIEAVFAKLLLVYGSGRLNATYREQDIGTVKRHWAHELRGVMRDDIAYGLTVLPADHLPNVLEFKQACMRRPVYNAPKRLEAPRANPEHARAVLGRLHALAEQFRGRGQQDPKAWAWKLKARHEAGEKIPSAHVTMYRAALARELGLPTEDEQQAEP